MKTLRIFFAALFAVVVILTAACGHRAGKSTSDTTDVVGTVDDFIEESPIVEPVGEPVVDLVSPAIRVSPDVAASASAKGSVELKHTEVVEDIIFEGFSEDYVVEAESAIMSEPLADMAVSSRKRESRSVEASESRSVEASEAYGHRGYDRHRGQRSGGAGLITAGEWRDLDNWDFWRNLLQRREYRHMPEYWNFEGIDRRPQHNTRRAWNNSPNRRRSVEVAFMVDATGSMSDELEFLKTELVNVVGRVEGSNPRADVLTGSVFYRDEGDLYVTRLSPFTRDVHHTADFIKNQKADGGGDYPEAVHTALEKTVSELQWSSDAHAKILFMLLDAPPHHRPDVIESLHASVARAAEKGIRIVPIVASGIDKETEFLMRFIAISTDGTYVFITDHSGVGNSHLEASVGAYSVELLNDLIVRLINKFAA